MREAIGPEALDAATLVINTNQQVASQRLDVAAEAGQLLTIMPIAAKQDDATHQWVHEPLSINFAQAQGRNINDEGRVLGHGKSR
jgi:hypothetical protein